MKRVLKRLGRTVLSAALCLTLLFAFSLPAFALETGEESLVDPAALEEIVQELIAEHGINGDNLSIGYCYLATGETWYYNEDAWFYAASVYKVPLMMLMAEKVYNGELSQDTVINGMTLAEQESLILTFSNNDYARNLRFNYFGGDEIWDAEAMKFSDMPEEDYDPNYIVNRYYNARYIMDVLKTLYADSERFPNVIDCLLLAEPNAYFRSTLEGQYDVAQKYGAYIENDGTNNNHAVGIIYTPNPIIVTVMTKNIGAYESVIGDAAARLTDYTLSLDEKLADYEKAKAQAEAEAKAQAEEAEKQAKAEAEAKAKAEAEAKAAAEKAAAEAARKAEITKWALIGGGVLLAAAAVIFVIVRTGRRKVYAGASRKENTRVERERRPETRRQNGGNDRNYKPKH